MPEWTGELVLDIEKKYDKSTAKNIYFKGAFKVMRPVYHDAHSYPCYYLLNPGGGYIDGDTYHMSVNVEEGAGLTLTTQSATKVYKTPTSHVYQENIFHLQKNSYLEYLPDALIAYKDAHYIQHNKIYMERGATLIYADILTPGWSPEGDEFSYDTLRLKSEIYLENELVLFDHIKLEPAKEAMEKVGMMEGYTHLGSLLVVGEHATEDFVQKLYETLEGSFDKVAFGISKLNVPGFAVRIMGKMTQDIEQVITHCHQVIGQEWYQSKPSFLRKY